MLTSLKSLTNSENTSSNPLQEACSGFQLAACDFKSCTESRLWFGKIVPKADAKFMNVQIRWCFLA